MEKLLKKILLIDENKEKCNTLEDMLSDDYEIIKADSDFCAFEMLKKKDISAVLYGKEEIGTFKKIKEKFPSAPVIALMPKDADNLCAECAIKLGAADFIRYPFIKCIAKRRIENVLALAAYNESTGGFSNDEEEKNLKNIAEHDRRFYIDPVTGVYNRRYFDDKLRDLDGEFAFAMLDMDNFKQINDTFGHPAGDAALAAAAQAIKQNVRNGDDIIRYGGDEFFLLLRNMPKESVEKKLESILHAVENAKVKDYPDVKMTISIGGAFEKGKLSQTLRKADIAMYWAKEERNSIYIYKDKK